MNTKNTIVKEHFDELASTYDDKSKNRANYLNAIDNDIIRNLRSLKKKLKVLDVGCGTGLRAAKIQKACPNVEMHGCDVSPKMIKHAKTNIKNVKVKSMLDLDYEENEFDVILCLFNTFGYLPDVNQRLRALRQFRRILKQDGTLFMDVMNFVHFGEGKSFKRTVGTMIKEMVFSLGTQNKIFNIEIDGKQVKGFVHGFTDHEMNSLFNRTGFRIILTDIIGYDSGESKDDVTEGQLYYICVNEKN